MNPGTEQIETMEAGGARICDFAVLSLLPERELRQLRKEQEKFVERLAIALSQHLRLELSLELSSLKTVSYQKLAQEWTGPSQLTLFKLEPLRGVSVLEISSQLSLAIVNRLMGRSGAAAEPLREISELEQALLEPTLILLLETWCAQWNSVKELKPSILGSESHGRFLQIATPETTMLVLGLQTTLAGCPGRIQICFPFSSLEPWLAALKPGVENLSAFAAAIAPAICQWNTCFNEVPVPVTAEWEGLEMTSRAVLDLKIGDFVEMNPQCAQHVSVRLGGLPKFHGRPGTIAGRWAVELTQAIKS